MQRSLGKLLHEVVQVREDDVNQAEPPHTLAKHENAVGTVPMMLRQMYALANRHNVTVKQAEAALAHCLPGHRHKFEAEWHEAQVTRDLLMSLYWWGIKSLFPELWAKPAIGIRHGWQVAWWELQPGERPASMTTISIQVGGGKSTGPPINKTKH